MKRHLIELDDIPTKGSVVVPFFGRELHVFRVGEDYRAAANTCPHFGGPLECRDERFVCPWHGASFDMRTGAQLTGPAADDSKLMLVSTRVEAGALYYVWGE